MELLNKVKTGKVERPIKVLQFGEGNFLRAFVDYMIDIANETGNFNGDIVLVKPIEFGTLDLFHKQECQYTVQLRGIVDGEPKRINRVVTSVADVVDAYGEYEKYAAFAKLPVFDPSSPEEAYEMIQEAFEYSEKFSIPVLFRPTTRVCHGCANVEVADIWEVKEAEGFVKDTNRWVIFPRTSYLNHLKIHNPYLFLPLTFEA